MTAHQDTLVANRPNHPTPPTVSGSLLPERRKAGGVGGGRVAGAAQSLTGFNTLLPDETVFSPSL